MLTPKIWGLADAKFSMQDIIELPSCWSVSMFACHLSILVWFPDSRFNECNAFSSWFSLLTSVFPDSCTDWYIFFFPFHFFRPGSKCPSTCFVPQSLSLKKKKKNPLKPWVSSNTSHTICFFSSLTEELHTFISDLTKQQELWVQQQGRDPPLTSHPSTFPYLAIIQNVWGNIQKQQFNPLQISWQKQSIVV